MKIEVTFILDTEEDDLEMINGVLTHVSKLFQAKQKEAKNDDDSKRGN